MDENLENRWKNGNKPFDGLTIFLPDYIKVYELKRILLLEIVEYLSDKKFLSYLLKNEDWHEHDAHINSSKRITEEELKEFINNELEKVFENWDDNVRILYYNKDNDFILRLYIDIDEIDKSEFDITLSSKNARELKKLLEQKFDTQKFNIKGAKEFFDDIYAG